ncbi:hypothetical protein D9619_010927 [Psilocybe cf. subviscida]|uniref:ATP-dependent RNA helicase n=1 Tax=Psilocybe cf. subviscida TaxID=2480587 RepID=A0A8H5B7Z1_9AGAR|nr:hypothetical protein D9619_010927 [Psilocybe cf. subviscida]
MASLTSSLSTQVARSASLARSHAAISATKPFGLAAYAPVLRRSFVMSALTRSALPRQLFPCDMLLARNASTAARAARIPEAIYAEEVEAEAEGRDVKDPATHFQTISGRVHPDTLKAITVHPFQHTHMSAVQARIFPLLPQLAEPHDSQSSKDSPRDLLVKAKTGTGKTMGFLVPAIEARIKMIEAHVEQARINSGLNNFSTADAAKTARAFATKNVGTLIISPTRELATQIAVEAQNLTTHHKGFGVQILVGGENKYKQISNWSGRKDVVVATPGRIMDLLDSEPSFEAALKSTKVLVLDEADTLLEMGFREDIERISSYLPPAPTRQTFLFSATVSKAIQGIASTLLHPRHTFINCVSDDEVATHTHIPQYTTTIKNGADVIPHVLKLIAHDQLLCQREGRKSKVILFSSTTKMTQLLATILNEANRAKQFSALPAPTRLYEMHSKRDMSQRIRVSKSFREDVAPSSGSVLVTSDVSARGVDYPGVTRVIQLGLPPSVEMYVHRIGRTGRGGDRGGQGRGDLVICNWEQPWLSQLTKETGTALKTVTGADINREVKEFLDEAPSSRGGYSQANYDELAGLVASITARIGHPSYDGNTYPGAVGSETVSSTLASHAGFYASRFKQLPNAAILAGIQALFQEMCAHPRQMALPRKLREMMGGARDDSGYRKRGTAFAYSDYGAGRRDRYSDYEATPGRFGGIGRIGGGRRDAPAFDSGRPSSFAGRGGGGGGYGERSAPAYATDFARGSSPRGASFDRQPEPYRSSFRQPAQEPDDDGSDSRTSRFSKSFSGGSRGGGGGCRSGGRGSQKFDDDW